MAATRPVRESVKVMALAITILKRIRFGSSRKEKLSELFPKQSMNRSADLIARRECNKGHYMVEMALQRRKWAPQSRKGGCPRNGKALPRRILIVGLSTLHRETRALVAEFQAQRTRRSTVGLFARTEQSRALSQLLVWIHMLLLWK